MYLAIDYGQKRIGLAIGSQYPRGIGTLTNPGSFDTVVDKIKQYCNDYDVEGIVIGVPVRISGEPGELVEEIENFADALKKKCHLPIIFEEEAYTSVQAEEELKERGINIRGDKEKVDELAAVLILEQYLGRTEGQGN